MTQPTTLQPIHPPHPRRLTLRPFRTQRLDSFHQIDPICDGIGAWWQGVLQAAFGNQNDRPFRPLIQQCHRFAPSIDRASGPLHRNAPPKTPSPRTMRHSRRCPWPYHRAAVGDARRRRCIAMDRSSVRLPPPRPSPARGEGVDATCFADTPHPRHTARG